MIFIPRMLEAVKFHDLNITTIGIFYIFLSMNVMH